MLCSDRPSRAAAGATNAGAAWEAGEHMQLTAIIEREGDGYVALCPQLDVGSQGETVAEARENLIEALTLFLEVAEEEESPGTTPRRSVCDASRSIGGGWLGCVFGPALASVGCSQDMASWRSEEGAATS